MPHLPQMKELIKSPFLRIQEVEHSYVRNVLRVSSGTEVRQQRSGSNILIRECLLLRFLRMLSSV